MEDFIESMIDWGKFDASSKISQRMGEVTHENLIQEVKIWEAQLSALNPLNEKQIKAEINEWKIEIPNQLSFENIAMAYTRMVSYKVRLAYLLTESKAWKETCEDAIKTIEDLAPGAFKGTGVDKKANSVQVSSPFIHLKTQTSRLENYLVQIHAAVIFCANQLDLLIKEKQSIAKLNLKLGHEGEELLLYSNDHKNDNDEEGFIQIKSTKEKQNIRTWR